MDECFEKRCRLQVKRAFDATIDGGESQIQEHAGAECTGLNFVAFWSSSSSTPRFCRGDALISEGVIERDRSNGTAMRLTLVVNEEWEWGISLSSVSELPRDRAKGGGN